MSLNSSDRLDSLICLGAGALAAENVNSFLTGTTITHTMPKHLSRKIIRMANREDFKKSYANVLFYAKRAAAIILVFTSISFAMLMSVESIRCALFDTIYKFYEDYIAFIFVPEDSVPDKLHLIYQPTSIPKNFTQEIVSDTPLAYCIRYFSGKENVMTYKQMIITPNETQADNKNTNVENIKISGHDAKLLTLLDKKRTMLIWSDGIYEFTISCNNQYLSREQLILIAQSVKPQ